MKAMMIGCWTMTLILCASVLIVAEEKNGEEPSSEKPTTVTIDGEKFTDITDVIIKAERKIGLRFRGGVASFPVNKVPADFLAAWGFTEEVLEEGFAIADERAREDANAQAIRTEEAKRRAAEAARKQAEFDAEIKARAERAAAERAREAATRRGQAHPLPPSPFKKGGEFSPVEPAKSPMTGTGSSLSNWGTRIPNVTNPYLNPLTPALPNTGTQQFQDIKRISK